MRLKEYIGLLRYEITNVKTTDQKEMTIDIRWVNCFFNPLTKIKEFGKYNEDNLASVARLLKQLIRYK